MRAVALFAPLFALLILTGCTIGPDGRPHMLDTIPAGYGSTTAQTENGLTWNKVDSYDVNNPSLPAARFDGPVTIDDSVLVFPVDGDASPYAGRHYDDVQTAHAVFSGEYGRSGGQNFSGTSLSGVTRMPHRVFFAHGSAHISEGERARLSTWLRKLDPAARARLDVTGHASRRVKGGAHRQAVNNKIAQRRAEAVARELYRLGGDTVSVLSEGAGVPNPQPIGMSQEAADRRVDVRANR